MNRTRLPLIISPEAFNELPSTDELLIVAVVQKAVFDGPSYFRGGIGGAFRIGQRS